MKRKNTEAYLSEELKGKMMSMAEILALASAPAYYSGDRAVEPEEIVRISGFLDKIARYRAKQERQAEINEENLRETFLLLLDCSPNNRGQRLLSALKNTNVDTVEENPEEELKGAGLVTECVYPRLTEKAKRLFSRAGFCGEELSS